VAGAEAYLRAKFHLDPSNRSATIHQRQTLVYCGRTVGWIKMKLGMVVGLGQATLC